MNVKLKQAKHVRTSESGKGELFEVMTGQGLQNIWLPASQVEFASDGIYISDWIYDQKVDELNLEIYLEF